MVLFQVVNIRHILKLATIIQVVSIRRGAV